jgi:hypothetical protein
MASGLKAGAFPSNVMVPVMDEAAFATPGRTATATRAAAQDREFPKTRRHGSMVIAKPRIPTVDVDESERCVAPVIATCQGLRKPTRFVWEI